MNTDIPRLTDDELDALLERHKRCVASIHRIETPHCWDCDQNWPCETVRLATEVRELRAERDAASVVMRGIDSHHPKWLEMGRFDLARSEVNPMRDALARYEEGGR